MKQEGVHRTSPCFNNNSSTRVNQFHKIYAAFTIRTSNKRPSGWLWVRLIAKLARKIRGKLTDSNTGGTVENDCHVRTNDDFSGSTNEPCSGENPTMMLCPILSKKVLIQKAFKNDGEEHRTRPITSMYTFLWLYRFE